MIEIGPNLSSAISSVAVCTFLVVLAYKFFGD